MKILFYCSEYPPFPTGGIGRVTAIIAEELVSQGHEVHVIGFYKSMNNDFEYSEEKGVKVFRYRLNTFIEQKPFLFQCIRKFRLSKYISQKEIDFVENTIQNHIDKYNIQLLELTDFYPFVLYGPNLKFRKFRVPTILRVHGSSSFVETMSGTGKEYYIENDSRHFNRCDFIIAVSEYSLSYIINNYSISDRIPKSVVYNPIEDSYLKITEDKEDEILFVGKLIRTKGCFSLAHAFNIIAAKYPNIKLSFVGKGDQEGLLNVIDSKYHDRVQFYGYWDREKLVNIIDQCSFACVPTYFENFSMVALEIMARGKTLLFTERTSGTEIVKDGINGFTVDPDNIEDISTKLDILINDTGLRQKFGKNAYNTIKDKFRTSVIISQLVEQYNQISCNN